MWLGKSFAGSKRWSVSSFVVDVVVVAFAGTQRSLDRSVAVYVVECVLAWFLAEVVFSLVHSVGCVVLDVEGVLFASDCNVGRRRSRRQE